MLVWVRTISEAASSSMPERIIRVLLMPKAALTTVIGSNATRIQICSSQARKLFPLVFLFIPNPPIKGTSL